MPEQESNATFLRAIEGAPMRWDRAAADLGSSPARWQ
jgi:hypothetical protein